MSVMRVKYSSSLSPSCPHSPRTSLLVFLFLRLQPLWCQDASLSYDPDSPPGEIQSDVVFREGQTLGGSITYTPRLIAMDLKGSLQALPQEGGLYDDGKDASTVSWDGNLMMHRESPPPKNSFLEDLDRLDRGEILAEAQFASTSQPQRSVAGKVQVDTVNRRLEKAQKSYHLEGSVKVWSDFLRIYLHPRTISIVHQYNHDGDSDRLEAFSQGEAVLHGPLLDQLDDKLHFFVEECDYFQGFQVLCDLADGFAGVGSKVTEMLHDDYGGRGILTWGLAPVSHPDSTPVKEFYHLLNCTLGLVHMSSHSSLFCPLSLRGGLGLRASSPVSFPHLSYDPSLWYHSSSVLAVALDALTVPYRLRNNCVPMWQVADALSSSGRKVVSAYGAVPFPLMHGGSLPDSLTVCGDSLPWKPISTCPEADSGRCYGQWVTLKGLEGHKLTGSMQYGMTPLHRLDSGEDVLASYISSFYPSSPLNLQLVSAPSKLTPPFPQIFSSSVGSQGLLHGHRNVLSQAVTSVPVLTSLQSGPAIGPWLADLHRSVSAFDVRRVAPSFLSQGLDMDHFREALEQLRRLSRCYRDDSGGVTRSSSEDDDDDD
ncbi:protein misato homolog 1 isoform X2 [Synchiropus splendidus]|uniref:protein misato homolog 1 isoform X2 n=1 Tax=Synchiropus splendidus TaxID=270530 RepID=UPI00237DC6B5|nr:protein misato homolog 1 isoform X2 [Synchiropus splendidus]